MRAWMTVLWPAFLAAAVLEMLVFSWLDPTSLHAVGGRAVDLSATAVYSLAFFVFWLVAALAAATTYLLTRTPRDSAR